MGVEIIMSKEMIQLADLMESHRREVELLNLELEDLRAYKALAIELANRKGFDSVACAIDSIGQDKVELEVLYNMISELWPKSKKPLGQVIEERIEQCTQAE